MVKHKDATCSFEKILEVAPLKTIAVRPLLFSQVTSDEQNMLGTIREAVTKLLVNISSGLLHRDAPVLANQQIRQVCEETGCYLEDLLRAMTNRNGWSERVKGIDGISMT